MPFLFIALVCAVASVWLSLLVPVLIGNAIDLIIDYHYVDFEALPNILLRLGLAICGVVFSNGSRRILPILSPTARSRICGTGCLKNSALCR